MGQDPGSELKVGSGSRTLAIQRRRVVTRSRSSSLRSLAVAARLGILGVRVELRDLGIWVGPRVLAVWVDLRILTVGAHLRVLEVRIVVVGRWVARVGRRGVGVSRGIVAGLNRIWVRVRVRVRVRVHGLSVARVLLFTTLLILVVVVEFVDKVSVGCASSDGGDGATDGERGDAGKETVRGCRSRAGIGIGVGVGVGARDRRRQGEGSECESHGDQVTRRHLCRKTEVLDCDGGF